MPIKLNIPENKMQTLQDVLAISVDHITHLPKRRDDLDQKNRKIHTSILFGLYKLIYEKNQRLIRPKKYTIELEIHQAIIFLDALIFFLGNTSDPFKCNQAEIIKNKLHQKLTNLEPVSGQ